ncbi:ATP-binding protein [Paenibacillus pasadenensis]|uniref:two-component system sensor histidine kinase NtrB n=1 Tax=Paenibacillus pasadenensis TaxID=217090 RepID=UPI00203D82D9|nr:ATP-binding protein [Paenibacillus pasadenensis]MCM3748683.1 ATP-binding protein [Paenibacillus pasadenensis]
MWEKLILQAFVSLLPVFLYQLWMYRINQGRSSIPFFCVAYGISLTACFLLTDTMAYGFDVNLRYIPFLMGSLYGGIPGLATMTVIYVVMRLPQINDQWELFGFGGFMLVLVPLLLLTIRPFQLARTVDKFRIVFFLLTAEAAYYALMYLGYLHQHEPERMGDGVLLITAVTLLSYGTAALTMYTINQVLQHYQLQHQLRRMSSNFMNEVHKLQQFIDQMAMGTMGTVIVDVDGRISHLNDAAIRLSGQTLKGRSRLEFTGMPYDLFFRKHEHCRELLDDAMRGSMSPSRIVNDAERTLMKTAFPIRNLQAGVVTGAAMVIQDITEMSQLRDELGRMERLSLVGQMAASITHEIRNPMAVIRGFVQLMRERSPDNQQEYFRIVIEELDRANTIINDFLSLAQNRVIAKEQCSLHHIIQELVPLLWADANLRGQSIELDLAEDIPMLELNDKEIKQMILNLARNGMEAMGDKGILKLATSVGDGNLELRVEDTGEGISADKLARLFEPFYTTKARGTGLGLPLCLSIVERHNGRIDVQTAQGEGTVFKVIFNLPEARESTVTA